MSSEVPETELRGEQAKCLRCKSGFLRTVTYIGGKRLPGAPAVCTPCVEAEREEEPKAADPELTREDRILELLEAAGVNVRKHGRCTLEAGPLLGVQFDCSEVGQVPLEATQEFVADTLAAGRWGGVRALMLCGPTGTGKTHLAAAACRAVLLDRPGDPMSVVFDSADRLIIDAQDTYGSGKTGPFLERREQAHLWVLDEFGAEKATRDALGIILAILNRREGHPTLITSNYTPDELARKWARDGEVADMWGRISSRLGQQNFRIVGVKGRDRRFELSGAA